MALFPFKWFRNLSLQPAYASAPVGTGLPPSPASRTDTTPTAAGATGDAPTRVSEGTVLTPSPATRTDTTPTAAGATGDARTRASEGTVLTPSPATRTDTTPTAAEATGDARTRASEGTVLTPSPATRTGTTPTAAEATGDARTRASEGTVLTPSPATRTGTTPTAAEATGDARTRPSEGVASHSTKFALALSPAANKLEALIWRLGGREIQQVRPLRYGDLKLFAEALQYGVARIRIRQVALELPNDASACAQTTYDDIDQNLDRATLETTSLLSSFRNVQIREVVPEEELLDVLYQAKFIIAGTESSAESFNHLREALKRGRIKEVIRRGKKKREKALEKDLNILRSWSNKLVPHLQAISDSLPNDPAGNH